MVRIALLDSSSSNLCVALPFFEIKTKTDDLRLSWLYLNLRTCDEYGVRQG